MKLIKKIFFLKESEQDTQQTSVNNLVQTERLLGNFLFGDFVVFARTQYLENTVLSVPAHGLNEGRPTDICHF